MAYLIAAAVMTLSVLESHSSDPLLQAFSSAIFWQLCHYVSIYGYCYMYV